MRAEKSRSGCQEISASHEAGNGKNQEQRHRLSIASTAMGRKPNPLILQHFHRGPKLTDASNRYEFTCKACGAHFPKGRTDNLVSHLTHSTAEKRCSEISDAEIARVKSVLGEQNQEKERKGQEKDQNATPQAERRGSAPNDPIDIETTTLLGPRLSLPVTEQRSLTGLEALAEASRQVERPGEAEGGIDDESLIDPHLKDLERRVQIELCKPVLVVALNIR